MNLHSSVTVAEQVKNIPVPQHMKITEAESNQMMEVAAPNKTRKNRKEQPRVQQAVPATTLSFIVDTLTCNKTSEIRKDEVHMGAFFTDALGNARNKANFFVGDFKKGQSISLNGNATLFSVLLDDSSIGGDFPQTFTAAVFLQEEDLLHNVELMKKIEAVMAVAGIVFSAVAIGMFVVAVAGGPFSPLLFFIAASIGVMGSILSVQLLPLITDDISTTATDLLVLEAPPNAGDSFARTLNFNLISWSGDLTPGSYTAAARWVVS